MQTRGMPRVLFVSKPVAPPFHDGAVCLVRDLAPFLSAVSATVLTTAQAPLIAQHVDQKPIYPSHGGFAPALRDNARVLQHLLFGPGYDLWNFVFAPNPASSHAGALAKALRSARVVQTVASRPRSLRGASRLLFGDEIVALSRHTADQLIADGFAAARLHVIAPPVRDLERSDEQRARARAAAGVACDARMFVYAGDLEFSGGAALFAHAIPRVLEALNDAVAVFACRAKTPRSACAHAALAAELRPLGDRVRFVGEVEDLPGLIASATAAPFAVDELYGKVDLPYAVLEACLLQVPVLVARGGPLEEIEPAIPIDAGDARGLAEQCIALGRDHDLRRSTGEALRAHVLKVHAPDRIAREYEAIYAQLLR